MVPSIDDARSPQDDDERLVPVLLRAKEGWSPPDGFEVDYQVGQFIKGTASKAAYQALAGDPDVISYEADVTKGRIT